MILKKVWIDSREQEHKEKCPSPILTPHLQIIAIWYCRSVAELSCRTSRDILVYLSSLRRSDKANWETDQIKQSQSMAGTRVRVENTQKPKKKKKARPARVAKAGQENIETMHEPKPIQATNIPCMDKVAVLWRIPMAHKPSSWRGLCHQGKYKVLLFSPCPYVLVDTAHGPSDLFGRFSIAYCIVMCLLVTTYMATASPD
jgi:hypothetical protein